MIDLRKLAELLHRELHPEAPPLGQCPFHDRAVLIARARGLAFWVAR